MKKQNWLILLVNFEANFSKFKTSVHSPKSNAFYIKKIGNLYVLWI